MIPKLAPEAAKRLRLILNQWVSSSAMRGPLPLRRHMRQGGGRRVQRSLEIDRACAKTPSR